MKNIFIINDSIKNKISYYHLALFLILLSFDRFYSQIVLISFCLHILIQTKRREFRGLLTWQNVLLSSVFLLTIISLTWSQEKKEGLKNLGYQLAILLFPLAVSLSGLSLHRYRKNLLLLFGITCTLTIAYLFADVFYIIIPNHLPLRSLFSPAFVNHHFSEPIGMHATYLSMYTSLSISSFAWFLMNEQKRNNRILYLACMLILAAGLLQLGSKSVIIATLILIIAIFPFFIPAGRDKKKFIIITSIIGVMAIAGITTIDVFRNRYVTELEGDLSSASADNIILEPRLIRWQSSFDLIKKSPLFGYGSGSERKMLREKYFKDKLYNSYLFSLNTHNQYLSFLFTAGIVGLLVFLVTLYIGFLVAWHSRDIIFTGFMILLCVVSCSENILAVNKGIFFYAFFFTLFIKTAAPYINETPVAKAGYRKSSRKTRQLEKMNLDI